MQEFKASYQKDITRSYILGWNDCLNYLLEHLDEFHSKLGGGQYDYFLEEDIENYLQKLIKK